MPGAPDSRRLWHTVGRMSHRVVENLEGVAAEWDALVERMPLPSPFLRSWWIDAMAAAVGADARIVLVYDGDELLGGLPLQRSVRGGVEVLAFLGTGPLEPDHLDVVAAPGREGRVAAEVARWLGRRGNRVIDLRGVADGSPLIDSVPGWGETTELEVAPWVRLNVTADEYLAARGGRTRSTVRRTAKRLDAAGVRFEVVDSSDTVAVEAALDTLAELHDGRWGDESGFLAAWPTFAAAARAGAAAGEVAFSQLVAADGRAIAIEVDFRVAGRTSFYQAGRLTDHDWRGSGSVLRWRIIEDAIDRGDHEFDLLRGGENYKTEWATDERRLLRIRRGVGPLGIAQVAAARASAAIRPRLSRGGDREVEPVLEAVTDAPTRPVRIAFYTDAAQIGGAETVATTLLGGLSPRFEVIVVGSSREVVDHLVGARPGSTGVLVPPIADRSDVAAMWELRRTLRRLRPDVFHANLSEGSSCQYGLLMALSMPNLRVVVTENSPMGVRSELSRRIKRLSAPRFDAHVGVGRRAAALVEADVSLPPGSVEVIPNAVPAIEHPPRTRTDDVVRIVAVSRFDPVKGLDVLVDAVGLLNRDELPPFEVVVLGDGPERHELESRIERLGLGDVVNLVGWVSDVRRSLVEYDLFVLPSRLEGLPMSLLEAMHAGLPVISTDVGSVREVLSDDEVGVVVPPEDPAALAVAISELVSDPERRTRLARRGREVALDRYSAERNVAAYEAVYDRILSVPTRRTAAIRRLRFRFGSR